jgi:hypothetical protein
MALMDKYNARTDGTGLVIMQVKSTWFTFIPKWALGMLNGEKIDIRDYIINTQHKA